MAHKEREAAAKAKRERERRRSHRNKLILRTTLIVLAVTAAVLVPMRLLNRPGRHVESQGRDHIPVGTSHTVQYNSDPPTSGPHYDPSARPGIYDEPIPDGYLVHSLEHGYVIISYNVEGMPEQEAESTVARLAKIAEDERLWKLIVVPRPGMEHRIALTAWQRIDTMGQVDARRIRRFISAWRDRGPERTAY
ncbi:MAG: DUF3105 domain-containing protein [Spirochaetaceae bacterium]|nr:MAG: DUF3105 domain-containing protein [Spirochaetaceae bacterium]